jgi:hypothetical protein
MKVDIHRAYQMSAKDNLFKIKSTFMISISLETATIYLSGTGKTN